MPLRSLLNGLMVASGCLVVGGTSLFAQPLNRDVTANITLPLQPGAIGYVLTPFLSGLQDPVGVATPPGETNRLFIIEQRGRILVMPDLTTPQTQVFLNITSQTRYGGEQGLLGLAFHPDYAENGRFFVFRTVISSTPGAANELHDRLSEFQVSAGDPNVANPQETILFQQYDRAANHNGGDLHFGPDGYLYVSLGDEGGSNDPWDNGQAIDRDFFSSILRLDVDDRPGSLMPNSHPANQAFLGNYKVPPDNPFVNLTEFQGRTLDPSRVRTEMWSMGLRNPWRFSFDSLTGDLWIGDVGQGAREAIFVSRSGANHGWAYREGSINGPRRAAMPSDFLTNRAMQHVGPIYDYTHGSGAMQGRSVTGGVVYRGDKIELLHGSYVFGDYVSGNIWALRPGPVQGQAPDVQRLTGRNGVSAFGVDPSNGDILVVILGGQILRLEQTEQFIGQPIPEYLSETGAFADLESLSPSPGMVPYEVNLPQWADGADTLRWVRLAQSQRFTYSEHNIWPSPVGTTWVQHFDLELVRGDPTSKRRLETRMLLRTPSGHYGVTYRWDSPTNAVLVHELGEEEALTIDVGGILKTQIWRYPGRLECMSCHVSTPGTSGSLGFHTAQLHRDFTYPDGTTTNQIGALAHGGFLLNAPASLAGLRAHAAPHREDLSLESRVRSYLAVNCAGCHNGQSAGVGLFNTRLDVPTEQAELLMGRLRTHTDGNPSRIVVPGDLEHSALYRRMNRRGGGQMPPLGSNEIDEIGNAMLAAWIEGLEQQLTFVEWVREWLGDEAAENPLRERDSDDDGASDYLEFMTGTNPLDPDDFWRVNVEFTQINPEPMDSAQGVVNLRFVQPPNVAYEVQSVGSLIPMGNWQRAQIEGNETVFPSETREVELHLPISEGDDMEWFRIRLFQP